MQVTFRPLEKQDALTSYKWRNNPDIWRYTGSHPDKLITPEMEIAWIEKVLANKNEKRFAILADGIYVGNAYITDITPENGVFHIFIGDKNYHGKGIGKQALSLIIEYAKNELNLQELFLAVHPQNTVAIKLYKHHLFNFLPIKGAMNFLIMRRILKNIKASTPPLQESHIICNFFNRLHHILIEKYKDMYYAY